LLHRLGFVDKKPKYVPDKLDPAKRKQTLLRSNLSGIGGGMTRSGIAEAT
jgi:hypothetical protein